MAENVNRSKLLAAFDTLIKDDEDDSVDIDLMLFTSFEFAPDFFEQNVLLRLDDSIDRLQQLEEIENVEQKAQERGVVVFHDLGRLSQTAQKVVGIPTVPVGVVDGFFHPKVVVISGTHGSSDDAQRVVRLMVSSANLTQAGWGKNVEVCGCIEDVQSAEVAGPLSTFLRYLGGEAGRHLDHPAEDGRSIPERIREAVEHLERIANSPSAAGEELPRLHVTVPPNAYTGDEHIESRHMLNYLMDTTKGPVTFGSPYFSSSSGHNLFDELEEYFSERGVTIVPGRDSNGQVEMKEDDLTNMLQRRKIGKFAVKYLPWDKDDEPRRQHLKFIAHGAGTIIGSHNATFAALGSLGIGEGRKSTPPRNVEVSLEWPDTSIGRALKTVGENTLEHKAEVDPPKPLTSEANEIPRFSLVVDWSAKRITYAATDTEKAPPSTYVGFEIGFLGTVMDDGQKRIPLTDFEERDGHWEINLRRREIDRTTLAETKKFCLYRQGEEEPLYVGFINERNRSKRTRFREPSPFRCLQIWCRQSGKDVEPSDDAEPLTYSDINADREAYLIRADHSASGGALGNYFFIYRAAAQMLNYLETSDDSDEKITVRARTVLEDGSGSIKHIVDYLQPDDLEATADADQSDDRQTAWLRQPLPSALLAAELELVLDRVKEIFDTEDEAALVAQDLELLDEMRGQLKKYSSRLHETVSETGAASAFLWDALTDREFFKGALKFESEAKK